MSFGYGGNRAKDVPDYEKDNYSKKLFAPTYDFERSNTPALDAFLVTFILYLVIAAIPMTAGIYYWATTDSADEILYVVIGSSMVLTLPIAIFLIYPRLFSYFNASSEEKKVRSINSALYDMYGV